MSLLGLLGEYKAEPAAATPPVYNITNSEEEKKCLTNDQIKVYVRCSSQQDLLLYLYDLDLVCTPNGSSFLGG